jgi:hypothetical protein
MLSLPGYSLSDRQLSTGRSDSWAYRLGSVVRGAVALDRSLRFNSFSTASRMNAVRSSPASRIAAMRAEVPCRNGWRMRSVNSLGLPTPRAVSDIRISVKGHLFHIYDIDIYHIYDNMQSYIRLEDLLMAAPLRKIVHTCKDSRRTRRGIIQLSTLECSHQEWTNAGERKAGKAYSSTASTTSPPAHRA